MKLEARNVSFGYGRRDWLLNNVNFKIESGEVVGVKGPSGSGKTTLARLLAGFETAQMGEILIDGKKLPSKGYSPVQLVFQHPETAVNPRWKMRTVLNEAWSVGPEWLTALGIDESWLDRWPNELSGGELQRFCVLRALGPKTRFLIADDMTTMLDAITQAQIWHIVLRIVQERKLGMIVISHEQPLLDRVCDRVVDLESLMHVVKD